MEPWTFVPLSHLQLILVFVAKQTVGVDSTFTVSSPFVMVDLFVFVCVCVVLVFELRAYTLSHSTSLIL
jgi:hypothetical protein